MDEEEEGSQGAGTPSELLASRIECQDQFLNAPALCFILSLPESQDFAAVHVVCWKATDAQSILHVNGMRRASLACPAHVSGRRLLKGRGGGCSVVEEGVINAHAQLCCRRHCDAARPAAFTPQRISSIVMRAGAAQTHSIRHASACAWACTKSSKQDNLWRHRQALAAQALKYAQQGFAAGTHPPATAIFDRTLYGP